MSRSSLGNLITTSAQYPNCLLYIKTPFQLTTLHVMGALSDLFDVSMDIPHGKFTSGNVGHTSKYSFP